MKIQHYEKTDTGKRRSENQDSFGVSDAENLFVVCDGMGGGAAGDFASQSAVDIFLKAYKTLNPKEIKEILGVSFPGEYQEFHRPLAAIRLANRALKNFADKYARLAGMGTTLTAALFDKKNNVVHLYSVGDSRVYRLRSGNIELLTKDHSKVNELIEQGKMKNEEVKNAEIQSMLTRALGTKANVKIDYRTENVKPNDFFIICSDGLNGELDDSTIRDIVYINKDSVENIAKELIYAANNAGGKDNSTAIVIKNEGSEYIKSAGLSINNIKTLNEETQEQSFQEDKILKKILPKTKIRIPEEVKEKKYFTNPVYMGTMAALLLVGLTFVYINSQKTRYGKELTDLTGKISGVALEVRTPLKEQVRLFQSSDDVVYKLQLIKDWYQDSGLSTLPLGDVYVTVSDNGKEEFGGLSGINPLKIELPKGNHEINITYPGYKIITEKMELNDRVAVNLEFGDSLKPVILIIVPEKPKSQKRSS